VQRPAATRLPRSRNSPAITAKMFWLD